MAINNPLESLTQSLASKRIKNSEQFLKLKKELIAKFKLRPPGNVEILDIYRNLRKKKKIKSNFYFDKHLKKRPVRSLSGVAVVSVLTKPWPCPGQCLYCPLEKGIPKSYLSGEPAVERAKLLKYNPYNQVIKRIGALKRNGHPTDKIELIVIGGSWTAYPKKYQERFIKQCYAAANNASRHGHKKSEPTRRLKKVQKINEKTKHRIIGISIETRPDLITPLEIKRMRRLGITRIELGIQAIDDKILEINKRGHGIKEIIRATKLLKQAGFKICYHMMPSLPGSTAKKDFKMFKELFINPDYQPDMLKIYPCVVTKGSELYKFWKQKNYTRFARQLVHSGKNQKSAFISPLTANYTRFARQLVHSGKNQKSAFISPLTANYKPYSDEQLLNLLVEIKSIIPPYVRIIRVIRDIPSPKIEGGSKISNLREVAQKEMRKRGLRCHCIRCREVKDLRLKIKDLKLVEREYEASGGKEIFLSYEDVRNDKLIAFLRLRLPNITPPIRACPVVKPQVPTAGANQDQDNIPRYFPELKNAAIIREIHTYGQLVPIGKKRKAAQHLGLGKKLIKEAEKNAQKSGYKKIAVISGIGVRGYYRKLGYRLKNTYMTKSL